MSFEISISPWSMPSQMTWKGCLPCDPFFDNHHAVSGQDGEDDLTRVGRVPEGRRA